MLVTHEREKLADAVIYFVKNTKKCGKTKLFKLLFFLDFLHFKETGKSVTGQNYYTWPKGPAPKDFWHEIKGGLKGVLADSVVFQDIVDDESTKKLTKIIARRPVDGKYFTKRERRIMEQLAFIYNEASADEMVEITHLKNTPWDRVKKSEGLRKKISYMLALDGKGKNELSEEVILERINEMKEGRKAFK